MSSTPTPTQQNAAGELILTTFDVERDAAWLRAAIGRRSPTSGEILGKLTRHVRQIEQLYADVLPATGFDPILLGC